MYACFYFLAFLLSVALRATAQAGLQLQPPTDPIRTCIPVTFTWTGGTPDYSFFYALDNALDPNGTYTDTLVGTVSETNITFMPPIPGGLYRFKVEDSQGLSSSLWLKVLFCLGGPLTIPTSTFTSTTDGTSIATFTSSPDTATLPTSSVPFTATSSVIISTTEVATTKQTTIFPGTGYPSDATNSNMPLPTATGSQPPESGGGMGGPGDGNVSSEETGTQNQPTAIRGGTNGPVQTAAPIRNTQSDEPDSAPLSVQARGAIIGTTVGATVLFVGFLCFRWRVRHLRKRRPVPIRPRTDSSGDDLTGGATLPFEHRSPMESSEGSHSMMFPLSPGPRLYPPRILPNSKQALAARLRRPRSVGSEASSHVSGGTWQSSHGEVSQLDTTSAEPEDEVLPTQDHGPAMAIPHDRYLPPTVPPSLRSPLSLQQLIGIELDNILSSPDRYSPDSPLYTPTSTLARDHGSRFRVGNETEHPTFSGGCIASTSKLPEETSSQRRGNTTPPEPSSTTLRGGVQRQRVPISRYEMECLADLVAARITREAGQRTEQTWPETGRAGPPPSYV